MSRIPLSPSQAIRPRVELDEQDVPVELSPQDQELNDLRRYNESLLPRVPENIIKRTGRAVGGGLGAVANALDVPFSVARDLSTWVPGGMPAQNPFDQLLPTNWFDSEGRAETREIFRANGLADGRDTNANFLAALATDMVLDPVNLISGGATKAGQAISKAGLSGLARPAANLKAAKMAGQGSKALRTIRGIGARAKVTPRDIFDSIADDAERAAAMNEYMSAGGTADMIDEPLSAIKLKVPMSGYINNLYKAKTGKDLPDAFVHGIEFLKTNPAAAMKRWVEDNQTKPNPNPPPNADPGIGPIDPSNPPSGPSSGPGPDIDPALNPQPQVPSPADLLNAPEESSPVTPVNPAELLDDPQDATAPSTEANQMALSQKASYNFRQNLDKYMEAGDELNRTNESIDPYTYLQEHGYDPSTMSPDEIESEFLSNRAGDNAMHRDMEHAAYDKIYSQVKRASKANKEELLKSMTDDEITRVFEGADLADMGLSDEMIDRVIRERKASAGVADATTAGAVEAPKFKPVLNKNGTIDSAATDEAFESLSEGHKLYNDMLKTWRDRGAINAVDAAFVQGFVQDWDLERLREVEGFRISSRSKYANAGGVAIERRDMFGHPMYPRHIGLNDKLIDQHFPQVNKPSVILHETGHLFYYDLKRTDPDLLNRALGEAQKRIDSGDAKKYFSSKSDIEHMNNHLSTQPIEVLAQLAADTAQLDAKAFNSMPPTLRKTIQTYWNQLLDYAKKIVGAGDPYDPRLNSLRELTRFVVGKNNAIGREDLMAILDGKVQAKNLSPAEVVNPVPAVTPVAKVSQPIPSVDIPTVKTPTNPVVNTPVTDVPVQSPTLPSNQAMIPPGATQEQLKATAADLVKRVAAKYGIAEHEKDLIKSYTRGMVRNNNGIITVDEGRFINGGDGLTGFGPPELLDPEFVSKTLADKYAAYKSKAATTDPVLEAIGGQGNPPVQPKAPKAPKETAAQKQERAMREKQGAIDAEVAKYRDVPVNEIIQRLIREQDPDIIDALSRELDRRQGEINQNVDQGLSGESVPPTTPVPPVATTATPIPKGKRARKVKPQIPVVEQPVGGSTEPPTAGGSGGSEPPSNQPPAPPSGGDEVPPPPPPPPPPTPGVTKTPVDMPIDLSKAPKVSMDETLGNKLYDLMTNTADRLADYAYAIPFVNDARAAFVPELMGGTNDQWRDTGRMVYDKLQDSIAEARRLLEPSVVSLHHSGVLNEEALLASGKSKAEAIEIMNRRNTDIKSWLESDNRGGAALPDDLKQIEPILREIRAGYDKMVDAERLAGVSITKLEDMIDYIKRIKRNPGKVGIFTFDPARGRLIETSHKGMMARNEVFKNLPGGTGVIDDMSIDSNMSGIRLTDPVIRKNFDQYDLSTKRDELNGRSLRQYAFEEYGDRLLDQEAFAKYDPAKSTDLDGIIRAVAGFDPAYAANQMPIFGRDFLTDYWTRLQDSMRTQAVARGAQDMLGKKLTNLDMYASKADQYYDIDEVLDKGLKNWTTQAVVNMVRSAPPELQQMVEGVVEGARTDAWAKLHAGDAVSMKVRGVDVTWEPEMVDGSWTGKVTETKKSGPHSHASDIIVDGNNLDEFVRGNATINALRRKVDGDTLVTRGFGVEKELIDEASRWMAPFADEKHVAGIRGALMALTNIFKAGATAAFPAFHSRNFISGQYSNFVHDAYDPRFINPIKRYTQPVKDAWNLYEGKGFDGIEDIYKGEKLTPEQAVDRLRQEMFAQSILSEKNGTAAEVLGDSHSRTVAQVPGLGDNPNPFLGRMTPAPPDAKWYDQMNPLATRGGITVGPDGVKAVEEDYFLPNRVGRDVAGLTEFLNRGSPYIAYRRQGYSPKAAKQMVDRNQADYSKLTPFERRTMRLWMPFYTYSRRIMPTVIEDLIKQPGGKLANTIKITNKFRNPNEPVPDHIASTAAIPFGETADGGKSYITGLGFGHEDTLNMIDGPLRGSPMGTLRELASRSNPLFVKPAFELASGQSMFFDAPGGGRSLDELDPTLGRIRSNIKDLATGERTVKADPLLHPAVEYIAANSPISRLATTARQVTDPRKLSNPLALALNLLTGVRVNDVSPSVMDGLIRDRIGEILKEQGARKYSRDYLPEYAKEKLSPDEQQEVDVLLQALKTLDKRFKMRRELQKEGTE